MSVAGVVRERVRIKGMHCATCGLTVEKALRSLPGVVEASADPASGEAVLAYDPGKVRFSDVVKAVRAVGYDVVLGEVVLSVPGMASVDDERVVEEALLRVRGVAEVYASHVNKTVVVRFNPEVVKPEDLVEALSKAGYKASLSESREVIKAAEDDRGLLLGGLASIAASVVYYILYVAEKVFGVAAAGEVLPWYGAIAMGLVLAGPGRRFIIGAVRSLRSMTPGMDALVTLGTTSIYLYSLAVTLGLLRGELYYEGVGLIIGFVLIGRYIEARVKKGTGRAVERLARLKPEKAKILKAGRVVEVEVSKVKPGDLVVVSQGERVPVDGRVVRGKAYVDESIFTGEPVPVEKKPGDQVLAGSMVTTGWIHVAATRVSGDTALDRIAKLIAYSQAGKMGVQRLADRISGVFFWIVLGIASFTFAFWSLIGAGFETAVVRAASVLLVSCPCALGLATPTASSAGVGIAARVGILVRNVVAFEKLARATVVALDKTGTLTYGRPRVVAVEVLEGFTPERVLEFAGSAEKWSEHPLARAIIEKHIEALGRGPRDPGNAELLPGMGVYAEVDGHTVVVGNDKLMQGFEVDITPLREAATRWQDRGATVVYVAIDGRPAGVIAIRDEPRPEAREAVEWLKRLGLKVVMLTGDAERTAAAIARELGIDEYRAGMSPDDKAEVVRELQRRGEVVVMVGDGVNDAPALSRADVGIAVANATDVSVEAGDIVLVRGDLRRVPMAVEIARRTYRTIKLNLFWAFIYNVTLIPIAAGALAWAGIALRPELAAAAMAASSISVTSFSYMFSKWTPRLPEREERGETLGEGGAKIAAEAPAH